MEVSSVTSAYVAQTEAILRLLEQTLEFQQEALAQLLQAMGIGRQLDLTA